MKGPLGHLGAELAALAAQGRLRHPPDPALGARDVLNLCSNDYLGYLTTGRLAGALSEAASAGVKAGAGASRLVSGDHAEHRALEGAIAAWLGTEAALLFSSGYAANLGLLSALAGTGDHIVSDALNHASIVDGCRLSRARVTVVPHLDVGAVGEALQHHHGGRQWVVTESYFSMDGDSPDLPALRAVCDRHGAALVVDEAHALGVYGPAGAGLARQAGVAAEALVGTLGKAAGAQGAFVAGSRDLCAWLWNRARSFVFSTGLSPVLCAVALAGVRAIREDDDGRAALHAASARMREMLGRCGMPASGRGPIMPVVVGAEARAVMLSERLAVRRVRVQAIRPPTVPAGTSRLRLTARADLSPCDLSHAERAFASLDAHVG